MKMYLLALFIICFSQILTAQNLVPNPSFEDYSQCPTSENQLYYAVPWYSASGSSTPDFYNECYTTGTLNMGIPQNWIGYQYTKTGQGYTGICVWKSRLFMDFNYREYIAVKLGYTLEPGKKYFVSFYASLADSVGYAIDDLQMFFSADSIYGGPNFLPFTPQITNLSDSMLANRDNWMQLAGEYIAQGNERFICISNFNDYENTDTMYIGEGEPDSIPDYNNISYYFIDDICISENSDSCGLASIEENNLLNLVSLFPNPAHEYIIIKSNVYHDYSMMIFDLLGNLLDEKMILAEEKLNISSLHPGMYFIQLQAPNFQITNFKFIKL